jgi:hypothetical protein
VTTLFTINFRREAYLKEVARTRRRVIALGVWVAYFGVFALLLGLYGLNCASLAQRVGVVERQAARLRGTAPSRLEWRLNAAQLDQLERFASSTRDWRNRLWRLGVLLPAGSHVTSIAVNPNSQADPTAANTLILAGQLRPSGTEDRMQSVMNLVSVLKSDSVFSSGFSSVRLSNTRVAEDGSVDFAIECR